MTEIPWGSLGTLLEEAKLLTSEQNESIRAACIRENMTVGEFLYEARAMPVELIRAGILLQLLVRDGLLKLDAAVKVLQLVAENNQPIETALEELGFSRAYFEHTRLIGYLLVDAKCVTKHALDESADVAYKAGIRLSKVLVDGNFVSAKMIEQVLTVEDFIVAEQITYETAVKILKICKEGTDLADALSASNLNELAKKSKARLSELLIGAELITPAEMIPIVEQSLVQRNQPVDVLVKEKLFNAEKIAIIIETNFRVLNGMMTPSQAVERFKGLKEPGD